MLTEQEIWQRVAIGRQFVSRFARNDRQACVRYRDASLFPTWVSPDEDETENEEGGDVQTDVAVGQSNLLTVNIITKMAAIAIGYPDWHIKASTPENAEIVRLFLRDKFRLHNWLRSSWKALQKRYVGGLGLLCYRWDDRKRTQWEHVQVWDLALDPCTYDFTDIRWAARRVKMPLREARERYGPEPFRTPSGGDIESRSLDSKTVELWVYWDRETEAHLHDGKVLNLEDTTNRYGRVPLLCLEGDLDPGPSIWPLGDPQLSSGLQAELSELNAIISRNAKHDGPLTLVDNDRAGKAASDALEEGKSYIPVDDLVTPPIQRLPGVPLSDSLLAAKAEAFAALDAATGVNQFDRGVIQQQAKFATEVAAVTQRAGSRSTQMRAEYERFLSRMGEITILLEREFGGAQSIDAATDEEDILHVAFSDVQEVTVIENSTVYRDPTVDLQQAMQRLKVVAELVPLLLQTGQAIPDLKVYIDDILRGSGCNDPDRYWLPEAPSPKGSPKASGQAGLSAPLSPLPEGEGTGKERWHESDGGSGAFPG